MILEQEINITSVAASSTTYTFFQRFLIGLACLGFFPAVYLIGKLLVG
jgi:hypothetical protein